jgi:hypothetical protein
MAISQTGNVGIGTTSPAKELHVYASSGECAIQVEGNAGDAGLNLKAVSTSASFVNFGDESTINVGQIYYSHPGNAMQFKTNATERMRIDSSGNVLIGTTSTSINSSNFGVMIQQAGYTGISSNQGAGNQVLQVFGNAGQFQIMGNGNAQNTNNSYGAISDRTLKENETNANSQWDDIKSLQIKNYNLIEYPDRPQIGVIAQDLEASGMNGLVNESEDGTKSVKYSVLYMKAVKCLQEAQNKIETLESTVADLTTRLEALENA